MVTDRRDVAMLPPSVHDGNLSMMSLWFPAGRVAACGSHIEGLGTPPTSHQRLPLVQSNGQNNVSYLTAIVAVNIVNVLVSLLYRVLPWSDINVTLNAPFFPVHVMVM